MDGAARHKFSIPTTYNGVRFRSHLESRWAEFFDAHRINWAYEPEGLDLHGVRYLPDFWLPDLRTVVEPKGILDAADRRKLRALAIEAAPRNILVILAEAPVGVNYSVVMPSPAVFATLHAAWDYARGKETEEEEFEPEFRRMMMHTDLPLLQKRGAALVNCAACERWQFTELGLPTETGACRHEDCRYIREDQTCHQWIHPSAPADYVALRFCPDCDMLDRV